MYATIRPEDILLSKDPIKSSARNSFRGKITEVINNGMVIVNGGQIFPSFGGEEFPT